MIIYGVLVSNHYDTLDPGGIEVIFAKEPDARAYAKMRSTERYANYAHVCQWQLDTPGTRKGVCLYVAGVERYRDVRTGGSSSGRNK